MYIIKSHYQFVDDDIIIIIMIMIMIMIMIIIVIEVVVQVVIDKVDGVSFRKSNAVIVPSYINAFSPAAMEQTDPFCVEDAILVPQNVVHSIRNIKLLFRFREEVVVRGSQIRRIRWMFDKLESTFLDSSHGHCGPMSRCIVLVEELSSCKVSIPNLLDFLP